MGIFLAVLFAWIIVPIILWFITARGMRISGVPAWVLTVIVCVVVAAILNWLFDAFSWKPLNFAAFVAIIYFGCNAFYLLVVRRIFPQAPMGSV